MQGAALLDNISYFLRREEKSIVLLLSSARRKKQRSIHRGVTDSGGKPPYVRVLVWLSGFRPTGSP